MLYTHLVAPALEGKRASFTRQEDAFGEALAAYCAALAELRQRYSTRAALEAQLAKQAEHGSIGARPIAAYDAWHHASPEALPISRFGHAFAHHEAAREWAERVITGTTTVAVDGSQILPWREVSIPVGLVQTAIFANPHDPKQAYLKDARVEVLGPDDLVAPAGALPDETELNAQLAAEELVNLRRFQLEARTLSEWMRDWQPQADAPPPLALLDGSLIVSFALRKESPLRAAYIAAVTALLETSEQTRVPLIAYIDTSFARDLATMVRAAFPERDLPNERRIHDGLLWGDALGWGDASIPFLSARGDVLSEYGSQRGSIAFAYLRAAADRPPARLEMPRWLAESELLPRVLDVLRAELVAGNGYPYAIETADAVAVITVEDRARFYQMFQHFAEDARLPLTFSRKLLSKSRRR